MISYHPSAERTIISCRGKIKVFAKKIFSTAFCGLNSAAIRSGDRGAVDHNLLNPWSYINRCTDVGLNLPKVETREDVEILSNLAGSPTGKCLLLGLNDIIS